MNNIEKKQSDSLEFGGGHGGGGHDHGGYNRGTLIGGVFDGYPMWGYPYPYPPPPYYPYPLDNTDYTWLTGADGSINLKQKNMNKQIAAYCADSGTKKFVADYCGDGSLFGSLVDSFEGLPSQDDQIAYILSYGQNNWTGRWLPSLTAMKNQISNMEEGEVRDLYKFYHDYHNPNGSLNDKSLPNDLQNSVTDIFSTYSIPVMV